MNKGASLRETGSRASTEPCSTVSALTGFDPARDWLWAFAEKAQTETPHVRKLGRYTFFAGCAWGLGISLGVLLFRLGLPKDAMHSLATVVSVVAFLALRDMSKSWDLALEAAAIAIEARSDATGTGAAEGESAGAKHIAQGEAQ